MLLVFWLTCALATFCYGVYYWINKIIKGGGLREFSYSWKEEDKVSIDYASLSFCLFLMGLISVIAWPLFLVATLSFQFLVKV